MTTKERARRRAAQRIGITYEEYQRRRSAGERWCSAHRAWEPADQFASQAAYCRTGRTLKERAYRSRMLEEERNWLLARVLVK